MEVTRSSETLLHFQKTTRRHKPEDRTLHNHGHENLESYFTFTFLGQADGHVCRCAYAYNDSETVTLKIPFNVPQFQFFFL
jgi:hypothetical protein